MIDIQDLMTGKKVYLTKSVSLKDKFNFYEYIGILLDGGVSISEALKSSTRKMQNEFFKEKILELEAYVSSGDSLSRAMRKLPDIFDSSEVSMVQSGETTGQMLSSFSKLNIAFKKKYDLGKKVNSALRYPMIVFIFLVVAIAVVMIYIVPTLTPLFESFGMELPLMTQLLVDTSNFFRNNYLILIFLVIFGIVGFLWYKSTPTGKYNVDRMLTTLPIVGPVQKNYVIANFASNLGGLIGSGVNIVQALKLSSNSTNNAFYEEFLELVIDKVAKGEKISEAIEDLDEEMIYFTPDFVQILSVGEKTATIEEVTKKLSLQYEREVDVSVENMTKSIEPIAIIIAGVFVLWFAFALYGAMLKLNDGFSQG